MLRRLKKILRPSAPKGLPYNHVDLFHWQPEDGRVNFGDHLSKIIVGQMLAARGLTIDDQTSEPSRLLGIGSILHFAENGDTVWGSGINGKIPDSAFTATHLDVRAVRGPLTAEFLRKRGHTVPDIFGDPGLLVPTLFGHRFHPSPERDYVFVPNLHDLALVHGEKNIVSPLWGWNKVIEEIIKAKLVLASSLHGLVIAESFGIPARYVRLTETENLFKYQDYFYGTGRENFDYATSIKNGLEMGGMEPITQYDVSPLMEAFPWDLWR